MSIAAKTVSRSTTRYLTMVSALTSCGSKLTEGFVAAELSPGACLELGSLLMLSFQYHNQIGIAHRQQGPGLQLPGKHRQPNAAHSHRRGDVHTVDMKTTRRKLRRRKPKQIHHPHNNHQHGQQCERWSGAL